MRIPDRGLGARAVLVAALAMAALAGPATAGEVAYLMYIKGSEGPPATPMRVLWDARDDANARITIDLGAKYEPHADEARP